MNDDGRYPELMKQSAAVMDGSRTIGDFIEWAAEQGIHLAEWERKTDCRAASDYPSRTAWYCRSGKRIAAETNRRHEPGTDLGNCISCMGAGVVDRIEPRLMPINQSITRLLARFFDIDLDKLEAEKRQMIESLNRPQGEDAHGHGVQEPVQQGPGGRLSGHAQQGDQGRGHVEGR